MQDARRLSAVWVAAALCACATATVCGAVGLRFVHAEPFFLRFGGSFAALLALSVYQRIRMPENRRAIFFLEAAALYVALAVVMMIYQTALATLPAHPISALIERADHAVGFDWLTYATFVGRLTPVSNTLQFCYTNWMREFVVALVLMTYLRKFDEAAEFALAYCLAGFACLTVTAFLDSRSYVAVATYALPAFHHPVGVGPEYLQKLTALRSGLDRTLDFDRVIGLVAFPSFHAGSALLLLVATRTMRGLWLPFFLFNETIMVSVISEGGHNLMDLVGGCAFAIAGIAAARALLRARPRRVHAQTPALAGA